MKKPRRNGELSLVGIGHRPFFSGRWEPGREGDKTEAPARLAPAGAGTFEFKEPGYGATGRARTTRTEARRSPERLRTQESINFMVPV